MNQISTILSEFLEKSKAESALVFGEKGKLFNAANLNFGDSVAAMSNAIVSMSEKFLVDLDNGILKQLFLKTNEGVIIGNKVSKFNYVFVFTNDASNLGLLMHSVEDLANELSKTPILK